MVAYHTKSPTDAASAAAEGGMRMFDVGKDLQQAYAQGEWDMFELITSIWYGKQYYFEDFGAGIEMVYSRASHKSMKREEAYKEFFDFIEPKE